MSSRLASLDSVDVTWSIPSGNNAPILSYNLTICQIGPNGTCFNRRNFSVPVGDSRLVRVSPNQLRYRFGELATQKMYEVRIRAENLVGLQDDPDEGEGHRFNSSFPDDGRVVNFRSIRTTSVVIVTWNLSDLALATNGLDVMFTVTYFREGSPDNIMTATVNNSEPLGFSADLSATGGAGHTFTVVANYMTPVLVSSAVEMMNVATLGQGEVLTLCMCMS